MLKTTMTLKIGVEAELRMLDMAALVGGTTEIADGVLADLLAVVMDGRQAPSPVQQFAANRRWLRGAYDLIGRVAFVPGTETPLLAEAGTTPQKGQISGADLYLGEIDQIITWFRFGDPPVVSPATPGAGSGAAAAPPGDDLPYVAE